MPEGGSSFRLSAQVVDAQGFPVADAEVRLRPGEKTGTTDERGALEFDQLESRRYWVSARKGELYAGPAVVRVVASAEPVLLRMHRGSSFVVHVTAEGAPVVGASVVLDHGAMTATTDVDGVAAIHGLSPQYRDGWVLAEGWAPAFIGMFLDTDPGGVTEHHITLRPGARVEGIVVGPGDVPIPETSIVLWKATEGSYVIGATSLADGTWHIDALEAGQFRVAASSNDHRSPSQQILECDGLTPQRDVVVRVDVGAEVLGSVVDKEGTPVPAAHIDAKLYHAGSKHVVADESGRFQIRGLEPGEYYVEAYTPTQASVAAHLQLERAMPVEVKLVLDDARVAGIVTDDKGEPVVEAIVRAIAQEIYVPHQLAVPTDSRGRFDLGPLQLGEYDLYVSTSGMRRRRDETPIMRVRSGQSDLRIVIEPASAVTGRVLLDGQPLPYFGASLARARDAPSEIGIRAQDARRREFGSRRGSTPAR